MTCSSASQGHTTCLQHQKYRGNPRLISRSGRDPAPLSHGGGPCYLRQPRALRRLKRCVRPLVQQLSGHRRPLLAALAAAASPALPCGAAV